MGTTAITRNDKYWSNQLYTLMVDSVDQLHQSVHLLDAQKKKFGGEGKPSELYGDLIVMPWMIGEHSVPTVLANGFETINLTTTSVEVPGQATPFMVVMPVVISGRDELLNAGPGAKGKILEKNQRAVMNAFRRNYVKQTFSGNVPGWGSLNTWNGVDNTTTGFLELGAVGAQTNTVCGLNKGSYLTFPGTQNQRYDCAGAFNLNGIAGMIHINNRIRARHPEGQGPDAWFMSMAFAENEKRALMAYERYAGGPKGGDPGLMYAMWDGVPCYVESDYMPSTGTNTTADPISAYSVSLDYMHTLWHNEGFFNVSEFESCRPYQDVKAALVRCVLQNIIRQCGAQGIIFDGNTW